MIDTAKLRADLAEIESGLASQPRLPELRAAHLDLVTLTGQLQGAVSERRRGQGETVAIREAQAALDNMKAGVRQVGMDIRLASEDALAFGLGEALDSGFQALACLDRAGPTGP